MSSFRVVLLPEAELDAREAFVWYRNRNSDAADRFEDEFMKALERIAELPWEAPEIAAGVRHLSFHRLPYGIIYAIEEGRVVVLAVMHQRRRPGYWQRRKK